MDSHTKEVVIPSASELVGLSLSYTVLLCTANFENTDVAFYATTLVMSFQSITTVIGLLSTDVKYWKIVALMSFFTSLLAIIVGLVYLLKQPGSLSTVIGHAVVFAILLLGSSRVIAGDIATIVK